MTNKESTNDSSEKELTPIPEENTNQLTPEQMRRNRKRIIGLAIGISLLVLGFYFRSLLSKESSEEYYQEQSELVAAFTDSVANAYYLEREKDIQDSIFTQLAPSLVDSLDAFIRKEIDCNCPSIRNPKALDSVLKEKFPGGIPDSIWDFTKIKLKDSL